MHAILDRSCVGVIALCLAPWVGGCSASQGGAGIDDGSASGDATDESTGPAADAPAPMDASSGVTRCPSPVPRTACTTYGEACPYTFPDGGPQGACYCAGSWSCFASCPAGAPAGPCDYPVQLGTTCTYADDGSSGACTCEPGNGGPTWKCGAPPAVCPSQPSPRQPCAGDPAGFGSSCLYPADGGAPTQCTCTPALADAGATWTCNPPLCGPTPPAGDCAALAGLSCDYGQGTHCACESGDGGGSAGWVCNGKPVPPCPATTPAGDSDCTPFPQGTTCRYSSSLFSTTCTCGAQQASAWLCISGGG